MTVIVDIFNNALNFTTKIGANMVVKTRTGAKNSQSIVVYQ